MVLFTDLIKPTDCFNVKFKSRSILLPSFFYCCSITVVPLFPELLSPPYPPLPPTVSPPLPQFLCPWVFYTCSLTVRPLLSPLSPFPLPSGYCQLILCFHVSVTIFTFILFSRFFKMLYVFETKKGLLYFINF